MSLGVTGAFSNINAVQRLNAEELRLGVSGEASWHHQYKDSCYIYIGGLDPRLTEGDVAIVFSQWGEPIDVVLVRDQKTGIPKGFGFLGYEDQRSTILAVDNANGMKLLQRTLRVDHCKDFRPPTSGKEGDGGEAYQPTGAEGAGIDKFLVTKREKELHKSREQQKKLQEQRHQQAMARAAEGGKDVDEMWAEEFELMLSKMNDEADAEVDALIREDKRLKKKLKKEKKLLKKEAEKQRRSGRSRSPSPARRRNLQGEADQQPHRSETEERGTRRDDDNSSIRKASGLRTHLETSRTAEKTIAKEETHKGRAMQDQSSKKRDESSSRRDRCAGEESSSSSTRDENKLERRKTSSNRHTKELDHERPRERHAGSRRSSKGRDRSETPKRRCVA